MVSCNFNAETNLWCVCVDGSNVVGLGPTKGLAVASLVSGATQHIRQLQAAIAQSQDWYDEVLEGSK